MKQKSKFLSKKEVSRTKVDAQLKEKTLSYVRARTTENRNLGKKTILFFIPAISILFITVIMNNPILQLKNDALSEPETFLAEKNTRQLSAMTETLLYENEKIRIWLYKSNIEKHFTTFSLSIENISSSPIQLTINNVIGTIAFENEQSLNTYQLESGIHLSYIYTIDQKEMKNGMDTFSIVLNNKDIIPFYLEHTKDVTVLKTK